MKPASIPSERNQVRGRVIASLGKLLSQRPARRWASSRGKAKLDRGMPQLQVKCVPTLHTPTLAVSRYAEKKKCVSAQCRSLLLCHEARRRYPQRKPSALQGVWLSQPEAFRRKGRWAAELWPAHVVCQGPGSSASDPQVCKVQLRECFLLPSLSSCCPLEKVRFDSVRQYLVSAGSVIAWSVRVTVTVPAVDGSQPSRAGAALRASSRHRG